MSTQVPVAANSNKSLKEELLLPQEILQNEFLLSQYLWDYISSFQSQCPSLKQRQQQQQTEPTPRSHSHSPTTATDGAADKGARHTPNPLLRLPGNPCRSLVIWRADRATTLITHNTQRYIASAWGSITERKRIVVMQRHPDPLHTQWRGGGRGEHAQQGQQQQQEKDFIDKLM